MAGNIPINMIKLKSSVVGEVFEVPETIMASQSDLIKDKIAEGIQEEPIVVDATAEILKKVIIYCEKHSGAESSGTTGQELHYWDEVEFFVGVDEAMLLKIREAATYLRIDELYVLTCLKFKEMMIEKNAIEAYEHNFPK